MEKIQRKPTNSISCPNCNEKINFYSFSGMGEMYPHFYCNCCSNAIHRELDKEKVLTSKVNDSLLKEIVKTLPSCDCAGKFGVGNEPKCPSCNYELKHQESDLSRLTDPYLILLENSELYQE